MSRRGTFCLMKGMWIYCPDLSWRVESTISLAEGAKKSLER